MENKLIVISGQTGVGKTTFLKKLNNLNIIFMDDVVKNNLYKTGTKSFEEVNKAFGPLKLLGDKIDTSDLGKKVLSDDEKLDKLSKIVNKYIKEYLIKLKKKESAIVEMAIYSKYEDYFKELFDYKVVVVRSGKNIEEKFTYMESKKILINEDSKEFDMIINLDVPIDIQYYETVFKKVLL